jgi:hypothetical protein
MRFNLFFYVQLTSFKSDVLYIDVGRHLWTMKLLNTANIKWWYIHVMHITYRSINAHIPLVVLELKSISKIYNLYETMDLIEMECICKEASV